MKKDRIAIYMDGLVNENLIRSMDLKKHLSEEETKTLEDKADSFDTDSLADWVVTHCKLNAKKMMEKEGVHPERHADLVELEKKYIASCFRRYDIELNQQEKDISDLLAKAIGKGSRSFDLNAPQLVDDLMVCLDRCGSLPIHPKTGYYYDKAVGNPLFSFEIAGHPLPFRFDAIAETCIKYNSFDKDVHELAETYRSLPAGFLTKDEAKSQYGGLIEKQTALTQNILDTYEKETETETEKLAKDCYPIDVPTTLTDEDRRKAASVYCLIHYELPKLIFDANHGGKMSDEKDLVNAAVNTMYLEVPDAPSRDDFIRASGLYDHAIASEGYQSTAYTYAWSAAESWFSLTEKPAPENEVWQDLDGFDKVCGQDLVMEELDKEQAIEDNSAGRDWQDEEKEEAMEEIDPDISDDGFGWYF